MTYFDQIHEAVTFLRIMLGPIQPRIGVVLGSGLGDAAKAVAEQVVIPFAEIPYFPHTTVQGHKGRIVVGFSGNVPVLIMLGRVHFYEGYTPQQVAFPMHVMGALGIKSVILTNAAGAISESYHQGQLVALADHINFMGWNPLVGPNEPLFAVRPGAAQRFTDMTEAYSKRLRTMAKEAAAEEGFALEEGVYLAVSGPSFETPAEIRAFRAMGATLVGMSTVPETIVARHMGINVLGLSCVTNMAAGLSPTPLNHQEIIENGHRVEQQLSRLLDRIVPKMNALADAEARQI
jgi:purine-nucleoside phosphorylase